MDLRGKRVVVTGAAGFIGSHLSERLIREQCRVVGFDNFSDYYSGKQNNIASLEKSDNFTLVRGDILEFGAIEDVIRNSDLVFHLAAQPGVRFSLENPDVTNRINIEGTLNVLEASKKHRISKIINASSSSVYGNPVYTPVDEEHPLQPISIYGVSKLAAEKYCQIYHKIHHLDIVLLRYHTVYGPRGRPDMAVFRWVDSLFRKKPITVFGDGNQTRDMTFVEDIVSGTIKAAETENISGQVFNLASGKSVSMKHVLEKLRDLINAEIKIEYKPARVDDAKDTHGNIKKAMTTLTYKPETNIELGLEKTVEWYRDSYKANV